MLELTDDYIKASANLASAWALGQWKLRGTGMANRVDQLIAEGSGKAEVCFTMGRSIAADLNANWHAGLITTEEVEVAVGIAKRRGWFDSFVYITRRMRQHSAANRERILAGMDPDERKRAEAMINGTPNAENAS